jgi:anti-anti-sigma factor
MTISSAISQTGEEVTITIAGRFDFSLHQQFRDAYADLEKRPVKYLIDMRDAHYLDSSALGMLLILRDYAGGDQAEVEILNCNGDVRKILTISNFEQLFTIH